MTEDEARELYLYPSGLPRYSCGSDNDGYPTCMGDGSMCGYSKVLEEQVCKYMTKEAHRG
ncbi:hypothetical protein ACIQ9R_37560 [Streptomyces sp. NPDC094447]|uniref:hypothetical protein n=1 Tax=Streptomyces sp. NPDC094447 TaxID=3366062 RepID=UPI00380E6B2A